MNNSPHWEHSLSICIGILSSQESFEEGEAGTAPFLTYAKEKEGGVP